MSGIIHSIFYKKKTVNSASQKAFKRQGITQASTRSYKAKPAIPISKDEASISKDYENYQNDNSLNWHDAKASSEYGSAEPSPTHYSSRVAFPESDSEETTDCDSESDNEATIEEFYERKYRILIKDLRKELNRSKKEAAFYYKFYKEYDKMLHKCEMLKREVYYLRHKVATKPQRCVEPQPQVVMHRVGSATGAPDRLCSVNDLCSIDETISNEASTLAIDELDEIKIFPKDDDEFEVPRDDSQDNCTTLEDSLPDEIVIPVRDEGYSTWGTEANMKSSLSDSELYKPGPAEESYSDEEVSERPQRSRRHRHVNDYTSAEGTSEEDNIKVLSKQLRRKGDCLYYKGRRKDIVSDGNKLYKRFGNKERDALRQFDYLQEMSTDISGFITSPDQSPRYK
ncbi:unnamed protein product [Bursaphelenchus okinawaensis]|uniref:Uncharacterized protein n=1 Tax=Bursaphelenchus okinawaensis TaxID=465554 RepID=A0A811JTS9_9BILA|nr:unnamed protein product [Bursaphelenchus okinawaensis]CAG9082141.1 unnamed protein product [Bursaphelenchus okinawaensis]